jgi:hypothetical protein
VPDNVQGEGFVDQPYEAPHQHACSLHPEWSFRQLPPWPEVYTDEDRRLIADEMRDCLNAREAFICTEPAWRQEAVREWQSVGGDPAIYEELFREINARGV